MTDPRLPGEAGTYGDVAVESQELLIPLQELLFPRACTRSLQLIENLFMWKTLPEGLANTHGRRRQWSDAFSHTPCYAAGPFYVLPTLSNFPWQHFIIILYLGLDIIGGNLIYGRTLGP